MAGNKIAFADNQLILVGNAIRDIAAYADNKYAIAIATGYFNLGGFTSIVETLEAAPSVRILIGAEPRIETIPDRLEANRESPAAAAKRVESAISAGRDVVAFAKTETANIERLKRFLERPTTEVRIYRGAFLHGKAFIFGDQDAVMAGSANFTYAGLNRNLELDIGEFNAPNVQKVRSWFDALWDRSDEYDLAAIFAKRLEQYDPHTIYLRMLYAQYNSELRDDGDPAVHYGALQLADFQRIGSLRAVRFLDEWNGAIIADDVGLGKTVLAGDVIRTFVRERGQHALIVCPASLRSMWRAFCDKYQLPAQIVSYTELMRDRQLGGVNQVLSLPAEQYRLIVTDEAHALRNPRTAIYAAVRGLLAKSPQAKLLMLTATPVNNSLWDLYYEVMLFAKTDNAFARVGIPDLRKHVQLAVGLDPDDIDPGHMFAVLDAVAVRRTRQFIKTHFTNDVINGQRIVFPTVKAYAEKYDIDTLHPGLFEAVTDAIEHTLTMARYRGSAYANDPNPDVARQEFLAGLLRSQMLKRFESSSHAFRMTLEKLIAAHVSCLDLLDHGIVPLTTVGLDAETAGDDLDDLIADGEIAPVADFDAVKLRIDLQHDLEVLRGLHRRMTPLTAAGDPKLANLLAILKAAHHRAMPNERKVLVFTAFVDTVKYIRGYLEELAKTDLEAASIAARAAYILGNQETDVDDRAKIASGFAPQSMSPENPGEDFYDLLVATDVLSEGQNLQQCGRVVNFDLPWNPMRIVQRNGRIDRIGSPHDFVDTHCFLPDERLDDFLKLEDRLRLKIAHANAGVGFAGNILPGVDTEAHVFVDRDSEGLKQQIARLAEGDASVLDDIERANGYSGEQFREELRAALLADGRDELEGLPWGIGSGHRDGGKPAVVFLARAGKQHFFRTATLAGESDEVGDDLLEALRVAQCSYNAERYYPDELRDAVYAAWDRVRDSIARTMLQLRDPANRQNALPRPQRLAIDLLLRIAPAGAQGALEALRAKRPPDIERDLRAIVADEALSDEAKAAAVVQFVAERGLKPQPEIEFQDIRKDDIRLVCYQLIIPGTDEGGGIQ